MTPTVHERVSAPALTGRERRLDRDDVLVSKTDVKGRLTYANDRFLQLAGYTESEILGRAHSIIRHPDMPRCVFRFMWQTIAAGSEVFAYVVNRSSNGDHYWVLAHVTPTFDRSGRIVGYHSNRRCPGREGVRFFTAMHRRLRGIEQAHRTPGEQWKASLPVLEAELADLGMSWNEFVFSRMVEETVATDGGS